MTEEKKTKAVSDGVAAKIKHLEKRLIKLEVVVKGLFTEDEKEQVGKYGFAVLPLLLAIAVIPLLAVSLLAGTNEVARYIAQEGNAAKLTLEADEGDDSADEFNIIVKADDTAVLCLGGSEVAEIDGSGFTAGSLNLALTDLGVDATASEINKADVSAETSGTAGGATTAAYDLDMLQSVTLTVTDTAMVTLADGTLGGGTNEFTFPEGLIHIVGATATGTVYNTTNFNATAADTYSFAIGTVTAANDDDLTSTEADVLAKQTIDTASGATASQVIASAQTSTPGLFDGTDTAVALYLNWAIAAANFHDSNDFGVSNLVVKVYYRNLGDI